MSTILIAHGVEHRIQQACQTAYKYFLAGRPLFVYCSDEKRLSGFSKALWAVEKTAFVPHPMYASESIPTWIMLCTHLSEKIEHPLATPSNPTWLMNLDIECPPYYQQFTRILEIVSNHEEDKKYARERMIHYKTEGNELVYHALNT
ncbi:DNA polymerase III subunit chi [Pelistega sp. NLN82]|uniref:DNA polymerase III subunit chi n=1 Tax=Pelistega ratti TaxID=2652177 RepID=A0A6L9Y7A5_9BURK|nr:DNA polymerase III subunit chi [Pelistega ratti]NEN75684.1 DNA polymerase III subunit chi [Pelistega ratti]